MKDLRISLILFIRYIKSIFTDDFISRRLAHTLTPFFGGEELKAGLTHNESWLASKTTIRALP